MNSTLRARPLAPEAASTTAGLKNHGLKLYLVFVISWFLHLPARLPILGAIRFDLLLVVLLALIVFMTRAVTNEQPSRIDKRLRILIAYSILVIPFVQWPGSVIREGIPDLIKVAAFYYFTIAFVKTERDLKLFISIFVACQLWRVMEPLFLHVTTGYWGDRAFQVGGEFLNRLSGAPHDIVNPNGLAFIICTVLPFLYLYSGLSRVVRLLLVTVAPLCVYALVLTESRTGILALGIVFLGIVIKSKMRVPLLLAGAVAAVVGFSSLSPGTQDRYLSLVGMSQKNQNTTQLRIDGMSQDFEVALRRPVFGHGIGTSREANFNFSGRNLLSHNIYLEVLQELGAVGLVVFIAFIAAIFQGFFKLRERLRNTEVDPFLRRTVDALQVWLAMDFIFSFASYGLRSYTWYLVGGLLFVIERQIAMRSLVAVTEKERDPAYRKYPSRGRLRPSRAKPLPAGDYHQA